MPKGAGAEQRLPGASMIGATGGPISKGRARNCRLLQEYLIRRLQVHGEHLFLHLGESRREGNFADGSRGQQWCEKTRDYPKYRRDVDDDEPCHRFGVHLRPRASTNFRPERCSTIALLNRCENGHGMEEKISTQWYGWIDGVCNGGADKERAKALPAARTRHTRKGSQGGREWRERGPTSCSILLILANRAIPAGHVACTRLSPARSLICRLQARQRDRESSKQ